MYPNYEFLILTNYFRIPNLLLRLLLSIFIEHETLLKVRFARIKGVKIS